MHCFNSPPLTRYILRDFFTSSCVSQSTHVLVYSKHIIIIMSLLRKFDGILRTCTHCSGNQRGGSEDHGRRPAGVDLGRGRAAAARQAAALLRPHPPQGHNLASPPTSTAPPLSPRPPVKPPLYSVHIRLKVATPSLPLPLRV